MTRSVKAFGGVWLICETERQARRAAICTAGRTIHTGGMPWNLSPCWKPCSRPAAVRWEENRLELALESTLPVMHLPVDINVRDLNALRRSYLVSLRYLQGIIERCAGAARCSRSMKRSRKMDDNVQNIRSGRALKGFGKALSGLGLVIAAIGAILGGAVPVIVVGVVLLIIGGLMSSAGGKKLQGAAQGGLAQAAMEQVLEEAEYHPGSCIDGGKFAESSLSLPSADNVGGSGLVCGKYHGRPLEISNLELSNTQAYQNPETEVWEDRELPIFKGQWMAADLGRTLPCDVQAAPKGKLATACWPGGLRPENPEFDRRFNVRCENLTAGQSLLSPGSWTSC